MVNVRSRRGRVWAGAALAAAALYGATLAPGLLWGDSGEAQLHVLSEGWLVGDHICRSHVPYYAAARALKTVFHLEAAWAANLTAWLFGVITIANVAWLLASRLHTLWGVAGGTALLLTSHTLWQLSVSAEVVSMMAALFTTELMVLVTFWENPRGSTFMMLCFINGLGVATHNMAVLIWPAYAILLLKTRGDRLLRAHPSWVAGGAICWGIGAAPLIALCVSYWWETRDVARTVESLLVGSYAPRVFNLRSIPTLLLKSCGYLALNFPTPVLLAAPRGWWRSRRERGKDLWLLLSLAGLCYFMFAVRYNVSDQHTFFIHVYVFVALACGVAVDRLARRSRGPVLPALVLVSCSLGPAVYALVPSLLRTHAPDVPWLPSRDVPHRDRFDWFLQPWRHGYDGAERFARDALSLLPDDALLVVDSTLFAPLNYLQVREGLHRDVRLDCGLARQAWLAPPADMTRLRRDRLERGRLFVGSDHPRYLPAWLKEWDIRLEPRGPIFQVLASAPFSP